MRALGVDIEEGSGSRVKFRRDGVVFTLHRPHPGSEIRRTAVRSIADFLTRIGVNA